MQVHGGSWGIIEKFDVDETYNIVICNFIFTAIYF